MRDCLFCAERFSLCYNKAVNYRGIVLHGENYMNPYVYLIIAIVTEVIGTTLLTLSEGFTKLAFGIVSLMLYGISMFTLSKALTAIDMGVAYATWCSVGMVLTSVIAVAYFGQRLNTVGVISIVMIMAGCVILNLYGTAK